MIDRVLEYERFLREYKTWLRAYSGRRQSRRQPLTWFQRGFNHVQKADPDEDHSIAAAVCKDRRLAVQ